MKCSMRRIFTAAAVILAILVALLALVVAPEIGEFAVRWWNSPERLAASPENPQVHFEQGGTGYARAVAAVLPAAVAQVEAIHGRRFASPAAVGAYVSAKTFRAATGFGDPGPVAGTFFSQVMLSPVLFAAQRERLPLILTHELSHAHLQGWLSLLAYDRLPNWFHEGLGVMVSGGGGAESVSEAEAQKAIRGGDRIVIESETGENPGITFEKPPEIPDTLPRIRMAYRQAGLFMTYLHERDAAGFTRMMAVVLDGGPLAEAMMAGYGTDVQALWSDFVRADDRP
jgi:hypothetical protein